MEWGGWGGALNGEFLFSGKREGVKNHLDSFSASYENGVFVLERKLGRLVFRFDA